MYHIYGKQTSESVSEAVDDSRVEEAKSPICNKKLRQRKLLFANNQNHQSMHLNMDNQNVLIKNYKIPMTQNQSINHDSRQPQQVSQKKQLFKDSQDTIYGDSQSYDVKSPQQFLNQ